MDKNRRERGEHLYYCGVYQVVAETALTITQPQKSKEAETIGHVVNFAKNTEDDLVKLIQVLLASPVVSMVAAYALVEYLQGVEVYKGNKHIEVKQGYGPPGAPGATEIFYVKDKEPLISQGQATTLEGVITTVEVVKSLGGLDSLGGLAKLIAGFIK